MLATDAADDAVRTEVIAEFGERPTAAGKAQLGRGLFGQAVDDATLLSRESRRCPEPSP